MNPIQQQLLDSYLRNELSAADHSSFESMMESDPAFREEVQFEQFVKEGIGEYRKAQLKTRLNAIDISSGGVGFGQLGSSALVKTIGGLITIGILGTAGYFIYNTDTNEVTLEDRREITSETSGQLSPNQYKIPEIVTPKSEEGTYVSPSSDARSINIEEEDRVTANVDAVDAKSTPIEIKEEAAPVQRAFTPEVNVPDLNEIESEEALVSDEVEVPAISSSDVLPSATPLDVKTIHRRSESIKYKYFEGKLYLYGDFKKQPYEILEINGANDRQIFVYYNTSYHEVKTTDKVEELSRITNEKLIHELEILRNNKVSE